MLSPFLVLYSPCRSTDNLFNSYHTEHTDDRHKQESFAACFYVQPIMNTGILHVLSYFTFVRLYPNLRILRRIHMLHCTLTPHDTIYVPCCVGCEPSVTRLPCPFQYLGDPAVGVECGHPPRNSDPVDSYKEATCIRRSFSGTHFLARDPPPRPPTALAAI